jgi:ppGpp synthetase/RelA/SpoT-type nucleotidyltranferase
MNDKETTSKFKDECDLVAFRAGRVHQWLEPLLQESAAAEHAYSFKGRTKTPEDIRYKVLGRRNHGKANFAASDVSDASGFRIVKLFNAEVPEALDQLLALLKTTLSPGPLKGRLKGSGVREIEFHTSRRRDDPLSIYPDVQAVVAKHGFTLKDGGKSSSYSSVHVLLDCEVGDAPNHDVGCSEIQLRSVFEEAWGEISHRLKYAPAKTARASSAQSKIPDGPLSDLLLNLDALKSITDGCAQYADLINRQLGHLTTGHAVREPQPLDPAEASAAQFAAFSPEVREAVQHAYNLRTYAVRCRPEEQAEAFRSAADAFHKAMDLFPGPTTDDQRELSYRLREELAFCYMFSGNKELRNQAEKIYRELLTAWPGRVSVLLRLGQIRRDADDYAEAIKLMEEGLSLADANPDPDPEVRRRISWLLRRDLAYIYWRIVDIGAAESGAALALMQRATDLSRMALEYAKSDSQHLNTRVNLLYYMADLNKRVSADQRQVLAAHAPEILAYVRPKVDLDQWRSEMLDSVARAEIEFGEFDRGVAAARVVAKRLSARIAEILEERHCSRAVAFDLLSRDERDMYLYAQDLLAADAPPGTRGIDLRAITNGGETGVATSGP